MTNGVERLLFHIRTIAGNILAILATNDGTTSLLIKDSDMATVLDIDSDGNIAMLDDTYIGVASDVRIAFDPSDGDIMLQLDDNAGSDEVQVVDSDGAVKANIDSDGNADFQGNITVSGTVDSVDLQDHSARHDPGGSDALTTAAAGTIQPDASAAEGSATSLARSDHTHAIVGATAGTITPDASAAEGSATSFARSDHTHAIAAAAPAADSVNVSASAEGSGSNFARADHTHNLDESITPTWSGTHTFSGMTLVNTIDEFSTDDTLGGDSDSAVPTEQAVKAYVDANAGGLSGEDYYGPNLVKNSPGQLVTDGAEPQWWNDISNATITDEDTAGETPPDIHERCFKVVTTANNVLAYQTFTFADEETLDAGVTVVSFGCWVYCGTGSKASIGIYGTNLGLQESSQAGASAWEWLTVEDKTLHASDTSIEIRLIVDTDTAWFAMPTFTVGPTAQPWTSRPMRYVPMAGWTSQVDLNNTGDVAWSDTDCTANTDPLATMMQIISRCIEPNGSLGSSISTGHNDAYGADGGTVMAVSLVANITNTVTGGPILADESQIIRYSVTEQDSDSDVSVDIWLTGYWMWA